MARRLPLKVKALLLKAQESAVLAVDIYNKPATSFRSGGFIVLMNIAWTSLFHAIFERDGVKYFYRDKRNPRRYLRIDGDLKAWELSLCVRKYFKNEETPVRKNLEFVIGLRNKIEHRFAPELDADLFGESQACLTNFEELMTSEFGDDFGLGHSLALALQFSSRRHDGQIRAIRKSQSHDFLDIKSYVDAFRASLSDTLRNDQDYSFRAFLIPKVGNHLSSSDVAIEFVRYDPDNAEAMGQYEKLVALIKERQVEVVNAGHLRCKDVAEQVSTRLGIKFAATSQHAKCWRYFKVRPDVGAPNPAETNTKYCQYDSVHKDYVYTLAWAELLIKALGDEAKRNTILA